MDHHDLQDGHRREDHRVADVRLVGAQRAAGEGDDGRVAGGARHDAGRHVEGQLEHVQADQQHRQAQHRDKHDAQQQVQPAVADRFHEGLARRHAHLCQKERETEVAQRQVGRHRHRPGQPPGAADLAQIEGHQQQPGKAQRKAHARQGNGNGAEAQTQRNAHTNADEADLATGPHRVAEHAAQFRNVLDVRQHADLVADLQRRIERDADVLIHPAHVQEARFHLQKLLDLADGQPGQLGVRHEQPQIVQLAMAAAKGVAHVHAQHLLGLEHLFGVHPGDQHHVAQLQRTVDLGRVGLAIAVDRGGRHTVRQPAGQIVQRLAHHIAVLDANGVHLQRNTALYRPITRMGMATPNG